MRREKREPRRRVEGYIARSRVSSEVGRSAEMVVVIDWGVELERDGEGCLEATAAPFRRVGREVDILIVIKRIGS